ncbi:MAG: HAD-IC family P-type ATPase, partial [Alphaproteobacteria bacterium]|nr:HAD-IC family P-type ATPase [Alphaproteobacteria bacterium]
LIAVADPIKASTPAALAALRRAGIRLVMATGDHRASAEAVARQLGIDEVEADIPPAEKIAVVRRLKAQGHIVAMVGDGLNDAPGLAAADVGMARGGGTEVAIQSAPVTLVDGELSGILTARALARATMRNIRQNLALAFVFNALAMPLAAGGLLSPSLAAAAIGLGSVSVIGNALRLKRVDIRSG